MPPPGLPPSPLIWVTGGGLGLSGFGLEVVVAPEGVVWVVVSLVLAVFWSSPGLRTRNATIATAIPTAISAMRLRCVIEVPPEVESCRRSGDGRRPARREMTG